MLEPTHSRQTARVKTWDGKVGTAQAQDGGIYEMTIETMDYAPVQVGDKIEIFWLGGKIESWRIAPKINTPTKEELLAELSGQKWFNQRSKRFAYSMVGIILVIVFLIMMAQLSAYLFQTDYHEILKGMIIGGLGGLVHHTIICFSKQWALTIHETGVIVNSYGQIGMVYKEPRYLAWQDIANAEIRKTTFFRLKYLHITPQIPQPEIKLALFLLDKQAQDETVQIIQKRIQAA